MSMLVDCPNCRIQLQLPPSAFFICCANCRTVSRIANPVVHPRPSPCSSTHYHPHQFAWPPPAPSPHGWMPTGQPAWLYGRKRAVICGVLYRNSGAELKGCVNDANCVKYLLVNRFGFPESCVLMLTEDETDPCRRPTRQNMRMALSWLVQGCQPGDSLVFHFSGHGSQQMNFTGDEIDGYDETLCPLDYQTQGMIVDDEINATIVRPLPQGVKLHAIIDACHSGTVLDLPVFCRMNRNGGYVWEDHSPPSRVRKGTSGGEVICFSSCDDHQNSIETQVLSKVASTGTMTFSFIQAIEHGQATTYGNMLNSMRATIDNAKIIGNNFLSWRQEPQLSANIPFHVYLKPFSL